MYWRMYSGHNCTNYAAYRMVKSGLPNERPWSGGGNATYWGTSMPRITDDVPRVGAVTWWKANTGPAGSAGHVGYVEQVISDDEIIVSQDSWGGDFSWAVDHPEQRQLAQRLHPLQRRPDGQPGRARHLRRRQGRLHPHRDRRLLEARDGRVGYQWFADGHAAEEATQPTLRLNRARLGQTLTVTTTACQARLPDAVRDLGADRDGPARPAAQRRAAGDLRHGEGRLDALPRHRRLDTRARRLAVQWYADGQLSTAPPATTLALAPDLVGRVDHRDRHRDPHRLRPGPRDHAPTAPVAPGTFTRHDRRPACSAPRSSARR